MTLPRFGSLGGAVVVFCFAAGLYVATIWSGFVFDDHQIIEDNPLVTRPGHVAEILTSHYWHPIRPRGYLYRPLTILSLRADEVIGSGSPAVFHATNVLLHGAVSTLVYLVLGLVFPGACAFIGAVIFAAHPIHTEAVAGLAGRADLLAALFVVAAWWGHLKGRPLLAGALFLAGLLSKESAVALPGILVCSDALLMRPKTSTLHRYGPIAAALAAGLVLRGLALGGLASGAGAAGASLISAIDNPIATLAWPARAATALKVMAMQAWLLVVPWRLSADYSFDQIPVVTGPADPGFLAGLALVLGGVACAWMLRKDRLGPSFPILFHLAAIAPVSNLLLPIGTIMAERILYLPSIGLCAGIGLALTAVVRSRRLLAAAVVLLAAIMGARTVARVPDWRDDRALFTSAVLASPRSAKAQYNLGVLLLEEGDAAAALPYLQRGVAIASGDKASARMMSDLGVALMRLGRNDEAIRVLEEAHRIEPDRGAVLLNLGNAYLRRGEAPRALAQFEAALSIDPTYHAARMNRARVLTSLARADEAVAELERVTRDAPRLVEALFHLAEAYAAAGRPDDAADALRRFLARAGSKQAEMIPLARERLKRLEN